MDRKKKKEKEIKEFLVLGLGRFGKSVALQLEANGCHVLAVDKDPQKVNQVADYVTMAMCVDIANEDALEELGVRNFDGAVIAIGHSLEAAVLSTIWVKEQGVKQIIAKAYDPTQGKILLKVGADEVIYPEHEIGMELANKLAFNYLLETIELTADYSIVEFPIMKEWIGKTLKELKLRDQFKVNVIAILRNGSLLVPPPVDVPGMPEDVYMILGENSILNRLTE